MEEIKVGDYVRTKDGLIGKIIKLSETKGIFYIQYYDNLPFKTDIEETKILKHNPNIKYLIEVGDYVNGEKVIEVDGFKDWIDIGEEVLREKDVKSIVTKEQFKSVEYKLEE